MGLMMSVLVFTVGVLEALSCLEHIRDSYLPLDVRRRRRKMVVDVNTGLVKHVDIPWPGDIPRGQHVIKKRSGYMSVQNSLEEDIVPPPMIDPSELSHALSAALFEEDAEESEELNQIFSGVQSSPIHSTQIAAYSNEPIDFIPIQESSSECEDMFDSLTEFENYKLNKEKKRVTFDLNKVVFDISVDASETEEEKEELTGPVSTSRIKHEFEIKSSHSKEKSEPNIPAKKTEEEKISTVKTIAVSRLISHDSSPSENKILIADTEECSSEDDAKGSSSDSSVNTSAASLLVSLESSVDESRQSDGSDSTSDSTGPTTIEIKSLVALSSECLSLVDTPKSKIISQSDKSDLQNVEISKNTKESQKMRPSDESGTTSDSTEPTTIEKSLVASSSESLPQETPKSKIIPSEKSEVSKNPKESQKINLSKNESSDSTEMTVSSEDVSEKVVTAEVSKSPVLSDASQEATKDPESIKDCLTLDIVSEMKSEVQITKLNSELKAQKDDKLYETEIESSLDTEVTHEKDKILINEVKDLNQEDSNEKENGGKEIIKKETNSNVLQDITDLNNVQRIQGTNETKLVEIEIIRNVSKNSTEGSEPVSHQVLSVSPSLEEGDVVSLKPSQKTEQKLVPVEEVSSNSPDKAFWLIFSGEYTKAMSKDWHSGHFCCWQCDESLTGQRYVLRDDHPYCIKCYESVFANTCDECNKTIGIDSKDLSYKDKHWHEACFFCNKCRVSLVDKQFGSKADKIYCGNCYDAQFASRCDGCGQIFRAGTKKMEYKTRQWHEQCFCCCVCKSAIGTKSFIPREQEIYCATCYEEKFATRCVKCNKIITSGGVTYKNEPWHRECFTCTNCSTSLAGQRFTSRDEKPYCADCFGELFAKRCTACCKPITGIGGTRFISFEDRHWHNDCFICASCKSSLVGRGFITDAEDILCTECAKQKLM